MNRQWVAAHVAALAFLAGCSATSSFSQSIDNGPARYESALWADGSRLVLRCDGANIATSLCKLGERRANRSPNSETGVEFVQFSKGKQYLKNLIGSSSADVLKNPQAKRDAPIASLDLPLLERLAISQVGCMADKENGDLLVACLPSNQTSEVVLFIRGLCDRCDFEPVVLRKVN